MELSGKDYLILLLGANKYTPIRGKLALQKEMFLMSQELDKTGQLNDQLKFEGYHYGPYSRTLEKWLKDLENDHIIKSSSEDTKVYELTNEGKIRFKDILNYLNESKNDNIFHNIHKLKIGSEKLGYKGLLRYVYFTYPDFIKKSKIKNEVLGGN
ncbi:MAG: hypothetical protein NKF70_11105 [Methanobacterium sp. ERen5]|nr:MAG: hypothetical protein NKF70_11105 [Methanobacterium sp. ERen5]